MRKAPSCPQCQKELLINNPYDSRNIEECSKCGLLLPEYITYSIRKRLKEKADSNRSPYQSRRYAESVGEANKRRGKTNSYRCNIQEDFTHPIRSRSYGTISTQTSHTSAGYLHNNDAEGERETYVPNGGRPYPSGPLTCPRCQVLNLNSRTKCEYCHTRLPRSTEEAVIGVGAGVGGVAIGAIGVIIAGAAAISSIARPP